MMNKAKSNNALIEALQGAGLPVKSVVDGKPRYAENGRAVILSRAQMDIAQPLVDAYNAGRFDYLDKRVYIRVEDQLDMIWHAMDTGEIPKAVKFYDTIRAVKDANPKPE